MQFERNPTSQAIYSPFPGWTRISEPVVDFNENGQYDGLYVSTVHNQPTYASFKQLRIMGGTLTNQMIGAAVGGSLLKSLYSATGVKEDRYNKVDLIHIAAQDNANKHEQDTVGDKVYLRSIFVPGYQEEFWKFAFRQYYKKYFSEQIKKADITFINDAAAMLVTFYQAERMTLTKLLKASEERRKEFSTSLMIKDEKSLASLDASISKYKKRLIYIKRVFPSDIDIVSVNSHVQTEIHYHPEQLAQELASAKITEMAAQGFSMTPEGRVIINDTIKTTPHLLKDFAALVAPRLLVGDYAVNANNFGIVEVAEENGASEPHLVAMNFNAACKNLGKSLNPFSEFNTRQDTQFVDISNLAEEDTEQNYYLEYSKEIRSGLDMAEAFISLGKIDKKRLNKMLSTALDEQLFYDGATRQQPKYGLDIIKEFCLRVGMYHDNI